jgi:hypothetical protein
MPKPPTKQRQKRWMPEESGSFYYIIFDIDKCEFEAMLEPHYASSYDSLMVKNCNCFRTKSEANRVCKKLNLSIKQILKER